MALDIQLKNGLYLAFPTPMVRLKLPEADKINGALKKAILDRAKSSEGVQRHNVGGWRSGDDLLGWDVAELAPLKQAINNALARLTQICMGPEGKGARGEANVSAWATVCRAGDYIKPHTHRLSHWSGVYYVNGDAEVDGKPDSGVLELADPRPHVESLTLPGNPFGGPLRVRPTPGLLVIHPSWLPHFVNPYWGKAERISIAFNALIKGITHPGASPVQTDRL